MKFIHKHPLLIVTLVLLLSGTFLNIPFLWIVLVWLAFVILNALLRLGNTLACIGYLAELILKKPEFATKCYAMARKRRSNFVPAMVSYSLKLLRGYRYEEALSLCQDVLKMSTLTDTYRKNAETNTAIALWKCGRIDEAIAQMQLMETQYELFSEDFYIAYACFLMDAGDYEKAIDYTELALEKNDRNAAAYDNLGQIAYRQDILDEAEKNFLLALERKSTLVDSEFYLGCTYEKLGEQEKALRCFDAASRMPISGLNTVTMEEIRARIDKYGQKQ